MPKIKQQDLKHFVEFTDWTDTPQGDTRVDTKRNVLFTAYAKIDAMNDYQINSWRAQNGDRDKPTHIIHIRERCDFEIHAKNFIFREDEKRKYFYKVISARPYSEDEINCYTRITASLWTRDSKILDPDTQDIPCSDIEPDFDYRDIGYM